MSDYDYHPPIPEPADVVRRAIDFDAVLHARAASGDRRAQEALERVRGIPAAMLLPEPSWPTTIRDWVATYPLSRESEEEFGDWCVRMCLQMGMSLYEAMSFIKDAAK